LFLIVILNYSNEPPKGKKTKEQEPALVVNWRAQIGQISRTASTDTSQSSKGDIGDRGFAIDEDPSTKADHADTANYQSARVRLMLFSNMLIGLTHFSQSHFTLTKISNHFDTSKTKSITSASGASSPNTSSDLDLLPTAELKTRERASPKKASRSLKLLPEVFKAHFRRLAAYVVDACGHFQDHPFDQERESGFILKLVQEAVDKLVPSDKPFKITRTDVIFQSVSHMNDIFGQVFNSSLLL
jgi:hypothetical protein